MSQHKHFPFVPSALLVLLIIATSITATAPPVRADPDNPVVLHQGESYEVTANDLRVRWTMVREGIARLEYEVLVQNLTDANRVINLDTFINDTSFPIENLGTVELYEWKALIENYDNIHDNTDAPIYADADIYDNEGVFVRHDNELIGYAPIIETYEVTRYQWKPCKSQYFQRTANTYKDAWGEINIPKVSSKPDVDNFGTYMENGTKLFKLIINAPIVINENGAGSTGRVAFVIDNVEYHPVWSGAWLSRVPITLNINENGYPDNYTVPMVISKNDNLNNLGFDNFADLRFTDDLDNGELYFWFENRDMSGDNGLVWVRLPDNDMSDNVIYAWFNNPAETDYIDNGKDVFPFFDNFDGGTLDAGLWNITGGTPVVYADGILELANAGILATQTFGVDGTAWHGKISATDTSGTNLMIPRTASFSDYANHGVSPTSSLRIYDTQTNIELDSYEIIAENAWFIVESSIFNILDGDNKGYKLTKNASCDSASDIYFSEFYDGGVGFTGFGYSVGVWNAPLGMSARSQDGAQFIWVDYFFMRYAIPRTPDSEVGGDIGEPKAMFGAVENAVTNTAPNTLPYAIITPDPAYTDTELFITFPEYAEDNDNDHVLYFFDWFKDGVWQFGGLYDNLAPTDNAFENVSADLIAKGENWTVVVTPHDNQGENAGENTENSIMISNRAPTVAITSPADLAYISVGEGLSFEATVGDLDGDAVTLLWDFGLGAGGYTSGDNPVAMAYANTGIYTVTATVSDGETSTISAPITITVHNSEGTGGETGGGDVTPPGVSGTGGEGWGGSLAGTINQFINEVINPAKNILFMSLWIIPVWLFLILGVALSWQTDNKGLAKALGLVFVFLLFVGARLV